MGNQDERWEGSARKGYIGMLTRAQLLFLLEPATGLALRWCLGTWTWEGSQHSN